MIKKKKKKKGSMDICGLWSGSDALASWAIGLCCDMFSGSWLDLIIVMARISSPLCLRKQKISQISY
jgi:hypothetical protein